MDEDMNPLYILGWPLGYVMEWIYKLIPNYGWDIILFTLLITLVKIPLQINQQKSMARMSAYQPLVADIQKKYRDKPDKQQEELKKLQEQGARNVLVSMAGDGAVLLAEDGSEYRAEAPKGTVKNSVGAGDSMVAGFIAGYLITDGGADAYRNAFEMGVCTGSASAFSEELATKEEVEGLYVKTFGKK